jgi:hypothetical protein
VSVWPKHATYGMRAGLENEHFLNAEAFTRFFARRLEPHGGQVGPLIFEFGKPPLQVKDPGRPARREKPWDDT